MDQEPAGEATFVLPAGVVTLLLGDIQGSVRLWEAWQDQPEEFGAFDRAVTEAVRRHDGVRPLEQGEGDSFLAAFARASDAVAAAVDLQGTLQSRWPQIKIRAALHTGEVVVRDGRNYVGRTIGRCARLRDIGHGGQTLMSEASHQLVADRLPLGVWTRDLGVHRLRDLSRPERVYQLCGGKLADEFPPLRSLDTRPNNLPVPVSTFIGRDLELLELVSRLDQQSERVITLTGSGGCGKTRLALQAAAAVDTFPGGTWFVDLSPATSDEQVVAAVAAALGVVEIEGRNLVDVIAADVGTRRLLLVLDNCEHVLSACGDLVRRLLHGCPTLSILATSRTPLGVEGEATWLVPSLSLPDGGPPLTTDALILSEAVQLFVERATRARRNFVLTDRNADDVAQIVKRLDGIPLAIELAAARARVLAPEQIAASLDDRFRLLTGNIRAAIPRQQTLRASVDWSHALLNDNERSVLRRCAVFAGPFPLDAAEVVCSDEDVTRLDVLDILTSLVDKSLLTVADDDASYRYRMLETIRYFAGERLDELGERDATQGRLLQFLVDLGTSFGGVGHELTPEAVVQVDAEQDNVRVAVQWGLAQRDPRVATLLAALSNYLGQAATAERIDWVERCLEQLDDSSDPRTRATLLILGAVLRMGVPATAVPRTYQALAIADELQDDRLRGWPLAMLGYWAGFSGDFTSGQPQLVEAVEIADRHGLLTLGTWARTQLGTLTAMAGDAVGARVILQRALTELADGEPMKIMARSALGFAQWPVDLRLGSQTLEQAAAEARSSKQLALLWYPLYFLVWNRLWLGEYAAARDALHEMFGLSETAPVMAPMIHVWGGIPAAAVALADGHRDEAERALLVSVPALQAMNQSTMLAFALVFYAELELERGNYAAARERITQALDALESAHQPAYEAATLEVLARLERAEGDLREAEEVVHRAFGIGTYEYAAVSTDLLEDLAGLAGAAGSWAEAARLFGAAAALAQARGYVRPPYMRQLADADRARVREALGDSEFEQAWQQGVELSWQDAVAYASRSRGERSRPSTGWDSLTPTEQRVVALVTEGLTNRQIADRMFISPATARTHLSSVFRKLDVATRAELAGAAARRSST